MKQDIILSIPPSVNALYGNRKSGKGRGRYITKEYRDWKKHSLSELIAQNIKSFGTPVSIEIKAERSDFNRKRDADNLAKPIIDLLVKAEIIEDDSHQIVQKVSVEWVSGHNNHVFITINKEKTIEN